MTQHVDATDPWAWARDEASGHDPDADGLGDVTVIVVTHDGARWLGPLLDSVAAQTLRPARVVVVDAGSTDGTSELLATRLADGAVSAVVAGRAGAPMGANVALAGPVGTDWLWLLHDDAVAAPDALDRLVRAGLTQAADVVGPLLIEPRRRRGRTVRIAEAGQTVTTDGVVTGVIAEGTLDQGQLEGGPVLGVNACGMLVRAAVWDALGGFDPDLPSSVEGLEFAWRAGLAGHRVVTAPKARVEHVEAATRGLRRGVTTDPQLERRRWGLTLHEAYRAEPLGAVETGRLRAASGRRALGFVAGKDLSDARLERRAVSQWRRDRASVERLRGVYQQVTSDGKRDLDGLRLSRGTVRSRRVDEAFGRVVDWLSEFGDRGGGPGLDALTGDDFARDDQTRRRLSPTWIVAWVLVAIAAVSARSLYSFAALTGAQLLPVPDAFGALFGRYADPVAGTWPSAGAPWVGLVWLPSLLTLGHPDLIVSLVLLGAVPLGFLLARRVLGRVVEDQRVAVVGGALYGLLPVLTGAVASGQLGTVVWTLTLPVLGHLLVVWWEDYDASWQVIGGVALTTTVLAAVEPLTWLPVAAAVVGFTVRAGEGWGRASVAVVAPALLLVTPFSLELVRFPGRLLTGIEPLLAPQSPPTVLDVLLARSAPQVAPLWLSAVVLGALWVLAIVGAGFRRMAVWGIVAALGCGALALALTRVVVLVPPTGQAARPQASAWLIGMVAALIWAAALGLERARASVAASGFDARHAIVYASGLLAVLAVLAGAGWWVVGGTDGLRRTTETSIPAFMRKDVAAGDVRILALGLAGDRGRWALLSGDLVRLGDGERGLFAGGDPAVEELAQSVADRLGSGAEDESIVPNLQRLGVGYIWLAGATPEQAATISNVPGLGVGAVTPEGASWTVPNPGPVVPTAQPVGSPLWAYGQAGLLLAVLILAAPASNAGEDARARAPRRAERSRHE